MTKGKKNHNNALNGNEKLNNKNKSGNRTSYKDGKAKVRLERKYVSKCVQKKNIFFFFPSAQEKKHLE